MGDVIRLAVDAESGDFGPDVIVRGIAAARRASPLPFVTYLCGDERKLSRVLDDLEKESVAERSWFIVEHCPDVIGDEDRRTTVWKNRRGASIVRCVTLQAEGKADASVSAGDTGILIGSALFILGRGEGVSRPTLGAFIPTPKRPVLVLDVGANLNCRAEHLVGFAELGREYMARLFGGGGAKIALLNIGTEPSKGPKAVREAAEVLLRDCKNYIGFVEGNNVFSGDADVVVCDGFIGNVLLKACESFYSLTAEYLSDNREAFETLSKKIDALNPENYGAVPFLGINGTVLKAHGGSSARSIRNAALTAVRSIRNSEFGIQN